VKIKPGSFFPKRELKTAVEVRKITAALLMAEIVLAEAIAHYPRCLSAVSKDRLFRRYHPDYRQGPCQRGGAEPGALTLAS